MLCGLVEEKNNKEKRVVSFFETLKSWRVWACDPLSFLTCKIRERRREERKAERRKKEERQEGKGEQGNTRTIWH